MNQDAYRKLISGESNGLGAALLRFFLGIAAQVYRVVIALRNLLYTKGWLKIHRANAAVISVGNITTGGTGKTPLVIRLCKLIISDSKIQVSDSQCAILTRGYKMTQDSGPKTQDYGDEPAVLAESCPEAKVIVNPNRVAGADEAVEKFGAKVLIMDDGFQHRRLARDLDIVTIDGTLPFGYGRMLPAGLLREPVAALKRADAVVITRCDQAGEAELSQLEDKLHKINPEIVIARSIHAPVCAKSIKNKEIGLEELKSRKIFAFCGIGNPDAFLRTVTGLGVKIVGSKVYNDHYHYTDDCLAGICEEAKRLKADLMLTTQKDWFSSPLSTTAKAKNDENFAYLAIELKFISGEDKITQLIEDALAGKI
ncbi:MAG TPA: tetraacyldisaccharide 4'-kinase [Sedimentisphaerales bacterium]|nr:tetraacyldisaccharide 4'-kinase [Sedimentisphaerales bacterium]